MVDLNSTAVSEKAPAVVMRHVSKTFRSRRALDDLSVTIETGEMTGSIEGALEQAMHVARDRQKQSDALLKYKSGCWVVLILFAGTGLGAAIFYHYYFNSLFRILDE